MDRLPYILHQDLPYLSQAGLPNGVDQQRLDLYLPQAGLPPAPPAGGRLPVLIWFHGGGFKQGSKEPSPKNQVPLNYLKKGFAVASVNYRLSHETLFPAAIHDAKMAVGWLRQHAESYQLDDQRFVAWGHSAGAYLSTMVGLTAWCPYLLGVDYIPYSTQVSAVISESAPINFLSMDDQKPADGLLHNPADSAESLFMGGPIQELPDPVNSANPLNYLNPTFVPRFLVFHGDRDKHIPYQQSLELVNTLEQSGAFVDFHLLPDAGHFDIDRAANEPVIDAFLAGYVS